VRITLLVSVAFGIAVWSRQSAAVDPQSLPLCNDINVSDEQIQAAVDAAIRKGAEEGVHPDSINSPDFIVVFRKMAAELGCRLPDTPMPEAPGGGAVPGASK
jgi:hypothetical protein